MNKNQDPGARLKEALASGQARLQPLTFPQREIWETSPLAPFDSGNNVCSFFEVKGPVTPGKIEAAMRKVVERQEVMRTSFLPGKDRPLQMIRSTGDTVFRFRELSPSECRPEALEKVMTASCLEPFDMVRGPLYRMDMLQRGPEDFVFVFTIHHAISDGWTLGAFVEDLFSAYFLGLKESGKSSTEAGAGESLAPLPMTYSEWGAAERARWTGDKIEHHMDFWKERLDGSRLLFEDVKSDAGEVGQLERWVTTISAELAESVRGVARKNGVTQFSAYLAAFQVAINRWNGAEDITVGSPVANRSTANVNETMGYFSGVVPLRTRIDTSQTFWKRLKTVHEETMDAFAHAIPFAELAKKLGEPSSPGRHTLFDVRFAFQNHPVPEIAYPGVSTKLRVLSTGTGRFDLACEMTEESGGFEVVWLYRPSVVPVSEIRELERIFRTILDTASRDMTVSIDSLNG